RIEALTLKLKETERELETFRRAAAGQVAGDLAGKAQRIGAVSVVAESVAAGTDLRALTMDVRGRLGAEPAVVALFAPEEGKVPFVVAVNPAGTEAGLAAGTIAK